MEILVKSAGTDIGGGKEPRHDVARGLGRGGGVIDHQPDLEPPGDRRAGSAEELTQSPVGVMRNARNAGSPCSSRESDVAASVRRERITI